MDLKIFLTFYDMKKIIIAFFEALQKLAVFMEILEVIEIFVCILNYIGSNSDMGIKSFRIANKRRPPSLVISYPSQDRYEDVCSL